MSLEEFSAFLDSLFPVCFSFYVSLLSLKVVRRIFLSV